MFHETGSSIQPISQRIVVCGLFDGSREKPWISDKSQMIQFALLAQYIQGNSLVIVA